MNRSDILNKIDELQLRQKDYKTMLYLVNHCSPKLFTKILEEILYGNMYISDFEPLFNKTVSNTIASNLDIQTKIENQYKNLLSLRQKSIEELSVEAFARQQRIMSNPINKTAAYNNAILDVKLDNALEFIRKLDAPQELSFQLYELLRTRPDVLLLETYEYNIPLEFENMILNSFDFEFMKLHNLTSDEMKKYKALSNYVNMKNGWTE